MHSFSRLQTVQMSIRIEQPFPEGDDNIQTSSSAMSAKNKPQTQVLLVEDNMIAAKVTVGLLTKHNCVVTVVEDVKSTLNQIKQYKYHLILLDLELPDGHGKDVALRIRHDPESLNQSTPIIAVTAHIDEKNVEPCLQSGIDLVLSKPLSEETVLKVLQKYVG